jgi:hypothetical protein
MNPHDPKAQDIILVVVIITIIIIAGPSGRAV